MHQLIAQTVYRIASKLRGENTFSLLNAYSESQWWSAERLEHYQQVHIEALLRFLKHSVQYYADKDFVDIKEIPILTKASLKENSKSLTSSGARIIEAKTTGGSTGQPVTIYKDREAMAREQAGTLRCYGWANILPGDKQARFWGQPINTSAHAKSRLRDLLLNRERFSAFNFTPATLLEFSQRLERFNPAYLYGYVSMLTSMARFIREDGRLLKLPSLKAVISTSEILTEDSRRLLESVFGVKVFNEYGCGEVGSIAHECEHGGMHLVAENLYLEVLDDSGRPVVNKPGRIVVTELHNRAMPLVRYELGDYCTLTNEGCQCGRGLPVISNIHGRAYDIIIGPSERHYHPEFFIYIFEAIKRDGDSIKQFQLVQDDRQIIINIVKSPIFRPEIEKQIEDVLRREFGDYFSYKFNYVPEIAREPSGKMRVVKRVRPVG